jgi:branched-chain amino acid transport system permease protein
VRTVPALAVLLAVLLAAGPLAPSWLVFLLTVAFAKGLVVLGLLVMMRAGLPAPATCSASSWRAIARSSSRC